MELQERYWKELVQLKFENFYLDEYLDHSYKLNNTINIITAISSSGSIAGWAIWNNLMIVWSVIIAASQVINAIKPYLPFSKRLKVITSMNSDISALFNKAEYNWFKVANGYLTLQEINELQYELKKERQKIDEKYYTNLYLPDKRKLKEKADISVDIYFKKYEEEVHNV